MFWRSEIQNGSRWVKIKVSVGLIPSGDSAGSDLFPCIFQLLETAYIP